MGLKEISYRYFPPKTNIYLPGDDSTEMFFILRGKVLVGVEQDRAVSKNIQIFHEKKNITQASIQDDSTQGVPGRQSTLMVDIDERKIKLWQYESVQTIENG